jgi:hypothetical protein
MADRRTMTSLEEVATTLLPELQRAYLNSTSPSSDLDGLLCKTSSIPEDKTILLRAVSIINDASRRL